MADVITSTTVDNFMQAADAAAARATIGAAALASPTFTGTPAAPTAAGGTNTTQLATTAFVTSAVAGLVPGYSNAANFAALPSAAAHSGETYFVASAQGVIWVNRKPAGLYTSDGAAWNYDADQTDAYLAGLTPTNGQIPVGNGTNFVTKTVSGDATLAATGALTVTKTNGVSFATVATSGAKGDVGLGSVTNDAQTKAAVVPNTAPSAGQVPVGNVGGTAYAPVSLSGPVTLASTGATTVISVIQVACSDQTTAITAATAKAQFRMPHAMTLTDIRASVGTAPTGSTIVINVKQGGTTIFSTKLSIDATEFTSTTAATPFVLSTSALTDDAAIQIDFDQVGATIAGAGVVVTFIGTRS